MSESLENIVLEEIHVDQSFNCRGNINPLSVTDLAKSIEANGLIQPIVIRIFKPDEDNFKKKYKLVAGFRRYAACKMLEYTTIKSIVHDDISEEHAQFINFSENLNRRDLTILEEAQTLDGFCRKINPMTGACYTEQEIMSELNISRGWLQPRLHLMKLPKDVHDLAHKGFLTAGAIRDLNRFSSVDELNAEIRRLRDKASQADGETISLKIRKPTTGAKRNPANIPKLRKRKECNRVLDHFAEIGFSNHGILRGIAWAAGNISDNELLIDIKKEMEERDLPFDIPQDGFVRVIENIN